MTPKQQDSNQERQRNGIKLKQLNYFMGTVTLIIAILLLVSMFQITNAYKQLVAATDNYIVWGSHINSLREASDYLTDEVRLFVETGSKMHVDNYQSEVEDSRRREKALEEMEEFFKDSEKILPMQQAMEYSLMLMEQEYHAMRLIAEAIGDDLSTYPERVIHFPLSIEEQSMTSDQLKAKAIELVIGDEYVTVKHQIISNLDVMSDLILTEMRTNQSSSLNALKVLLGNEQGLTIIVIIVTLFVILITTLTVIKPLVRNVDNIKEEKPLPEKGAYEIRFLARTYNQIYRANRSKEKQLKYDASHDYLTGLYNRQGLEEKLKTIDVDRCALIIVDADNFKNTNDTFGHEIGDKVLTHIADVLKESFRTGDILCRYGGDEFLVLLTNTDESMKTNIEERIRSINQKLCAIDEDMPRITVSAGIAFGMGESLMSLFEKADKALYFTKQNGKQGFTFYDPEHAAMYPDLPSA